MEQLNYVTTYCSCEGMKYRPKEIRTMYYDQYGRETKKKFFKSNKR